MEAVVSDILRSRKQEPSGLSTTAAMSLAAHAVAVVGLALVPGLLPTTRVAPPMVMTISLGGAAGPNNGGATMMGGRTIQATDPAAVPKMDRIAMPTPAKTEPAMVLPVPDPKMKPRAVTKTPPAANDKGRVTGRGAEAQKGSATVETGARGMGFGLSTSAGGGTGGVKLDSDFCCPEYITDMVARIKEHWNPQVQGTGVNVVKYTIRRNGEISDIQLERSSNTFTLDQASQRALYLTAKLPPLPTAWSDDHLTVHLTFEYERR